MKKSIFLLLVVTVLFSCKQNNKYDNDHNGHMDKGHMNNDSTVMHNDSTMTYHEGQMMNSAGMYSCSMHPSVHGKMNDKCSECGMDLTMTTPKTSEENK